jgi:tetratricopeptide (TPR) repeat protein
MGAGEPKPGGDPKPMGGMDPKNPMGGDQKPSPSDSKAQGDGKGEPKPSAGMPGGDSKPMSGMPMGGMPPMGGSPSQSKPSPGGGMPSPGGMPPPGGPQGPKDQAQEDVQKAVPPQSEAEQDIRGGDNKQASKNQDKAIEQLEKALKELEKRLKQLREKELEKLLANLEERVGRMLRMQIEVKAATEIIDKAVQKNPGPNGKAQTAEIQKAQAESDKELAIISEADKTLKLMEGEGSAVVFAGVLSQVRGDMVAVQKRLNEGRVEKRTQEIEQDIIDQLTMMKEALKKAKQDLKDPPKPGDPKDGGKPPDKKLIDLINELKLIKSLQEQVNKRTIGYSKDDPGEQAKDPLVQTELQQLAERQRVLQEMLHKIATQANQ